MSQLTIVETKNQLDYKIGTLENLIENSKNNNSSCKEEKVDDVKENEKSIKEPNLLAKENKESLKHSPKHLKEAKEIKGDEEIKGNEQINDKIDLETNSIEEIKEIKSNEQTNDKIDLETNSVEEIEIVNVDSKVSNICNDVNSGLPNVITTENAEDNINLEDTNKEKQKENKKEEISDIKEGNKKEEISGIKLDSNQEEDKISYIQKEDSALKQEKLNASKCRESITATENILCGNFETNQRNSIMEDKMLSELIEDGSVAPKKRESLTRLKNVEHIKPILFDDNEIEIIEQKKEIKEENGIIPQKKQSMSRLSSTHGSKVLNFDEDNQEEMKKVENNQTEDLENSRINFNEDIDEDKINGLTEMTIKEEINEYSQISSSSPNHEKIKQATKPSLVLDRSQCLTFKKRLSVIAKKIGEDLFTNELKLNKPSEVVNVDLFKSSISAPRSRKTITMPIIDDKGRIRSVEKPITNGVLNERYSISTNTTMNLNRDIEEEENQTDSKMEEEMKSIQSNLRLSTMRNDNI